MPFIDKGYQPFSSLIRFVNTDTLVLHKAAPNSGQIMLTSWNFYITTYSTTASAYLQDSAGNKYAFTNVSGAYDYHPIQGANIGIPVSALERFDLVFNAAGIAGFSIIEGYIK